MTKQDMAVYFPTQYMIAGSLGTFSDELSFKKKFIKELQKSPAYRDVLEIENGVEPGMPDLIAIDSDNQAIFLETKYAVKGVFTFKKTQIPWYRRHKKLTITVVVYDDQTTKLHVIGSDYILKNAKTNRFKLLKEE